MTEKELMTEALALAKLSFDEGEVPVGAVVALDGKIVGTGRNRRETQKNALCHAEIEAIDSACKKLSGWRLWQCEMFVTLEPCPMCAGAIINSRIKKVTFGAYDKKNGACGSVTDLTVMDFNHKPQKTGGFMEDECKTLLSDFFKELRTKKSAEKAERRKNSMEKIESFKIDHTKLLKGMYVSRIDGDVVTYDIRMRRPNIEPVMETGAMHTIEHLFATFARNSEYSKNIIYFGPMGCRTGFYFLTTGITDGEALELTKRALKFISEYEGEIPGVSPEECGNYRDHNLCLAKKEAAAQYDVLKDLAACDMHY